jgi:hypothetical protein
MDPELVRCDEIYFVNLKTRCLNSNTFSHCHLEYIFICAKESKKIAKKKSAIFFPGTMPGAPTGYPTHPQNMNQNRGGRPPCFFAPVEMPTGNNSSAGNVNRNYTRKFPVRMPSANNSSAGNVKREIPSANNSTLYRRNLQLKMYY